MSISQNILDKNYLVVTNSIISSLWVFLCAHNREAQQYLLEKIEKKINLNLRNKTNAYNNFISESLIVYFF